MILLQRQNPLTSSHTTKDAYTTSCSRHGWKVGGRKLSGPGWLVIYRYGMPARRRSPIDSAAGSNSRALSRKSDALEPLA